MLAAVMVFKYPLEISVSPWSSPVAIIPTNSSQFPAELFLVLLDFLKKTTASDFYLLVTN